VHNVSDVRQIEVHTAEPLLPGHRHLEVEISIAKLEKDKLPANLIDSIGKKEELLDQRNESIIVSVHKKADKTGCN
jgi:hypothetical protein